MMPLALLDPAAGPAVPAAALLDGPGGEFLFGPATTGLRHQVARAALTDLPVLIEGEPGTGKALLARTLHRLSLRATGPFLAVGARSLASDRFESDLFGELAGETPCPLGHREGLASLADGGTLLLDEVGELPAASQARLARFLDFASLRAVGASCARTVDVRIVAASRRELRSEVRAGRFRADLYYRLRGILIRVPPLRERREDVPEIAEHLLRRAALRQGKCLAGFGPEALEAILSHPLPGNLRDLQAAVERAVAATPDGSAVQPEALFPDGMPLLESGGLREFRRERQREMVSSALEARGWNVSATARDLGISRVGLCKKIKTLGLVRPSRGDSGNTLAQ
jgi:DNA-binding NtrC family response regulator